MSPNLTVTYKGVHGLPEQVQEANAILVKGQQYQVIGGFMASSRAGYQLKEFPEKVFNTVLFEQNQEAFNWLIEKDYPGFLNKKNK